jgi:hypothetical protein
MHKDVHNIHQGAYHIYYYYYMIHICTVHMRYAHICICIYVHVSECIEFSQELYPLHVCMYANFNQPIYRQILSDIHLRNGAYLNVFDCSIPL